MVRNKRKISADQYFYWEGAPGHLLVFLPGPYFKNFVLCLAPPPKRKRLPAVDHNFVNFLHHSHQGPILISSFDRVWRLAGAADEENDKIWRRRAPPRFKKERLKD